MNILMLTNTFTPHVGGVAQSVEAFSTEFRRRGHRVLIGAPYFDGTPGNETDVVRLPAVQHFHGSDFSVPMPVIGRLKSALHAFRPDIVHSHHPFLLGDTALRLAATRNIPVVFTHHTLYEKYTHYVPADSPRLRRFVVDLATGYCNLCNAVIAPSDSIAQLLRQRGATVSIDVIPTGVDVDLFAAGDGPAARAAMQIPPEAFVVGHVGRLAPEKNLGFLTDGVARFLLSREAAHFLLAGEGPLKQEILKKFAALKLDGRIHLAGVLGRKALAGIYRAMNVFTFASRTETQGIVLTEAMAAGVPVVAVDAPGVREVVQDRSNGRLLPRENMPQFIDALTWVAGLDSTEKQRVIMGACCTAREFSIVTTATSTLALYARLIGQQPIMKNIDASRWASARRRIKEEWRILRNVSHAVGDAVLSSPKAGGR
jgi:glycosyltransferase involved in cell wall biosynthesis